jgi:hypothetical protein
MIHTYNTTDVQKSTPEAIIPLAMIREIEDMKNSKVDVTIGRTADKAYDYPDRIRHMYQYIDEGIKQFSLPQKIARKKHKTLGFFSLLPVPTPIRMKRIKKVDKELLHYRKARVRYGTPIDISSARFVYQLA